ncbi:MAG: hypothetical protein ACK4RF_06025 [Cyclobacteriaceae bacterium]
MVEKLGTTLAGMPDVEVHCIGFPVTGLYDNTPTLQLHAHSAKPFSRISVGRIVAPFRVFVKILQLKPSILFITTHELLWVALLSKLITRCKIIYDVQENYFYNILYTNAFPILLRPPLALYVRCKEILSKPFVNYFILAEKSYATEMPFARPCIVAENKLPFRIARTYKHKPSAEICHLVFSGTLAETTGVTEAIDLAEKLHEHNPSITLTLIGNCPSKRFLSKLHQRIAACPFIRFNAGVYPIAHHLILEALSKADAGIIIYPPNPATAGSIPTKLYEYLALHVPVIIRHNEPSHQLVKQLNAGVVLTESHTPKMIITELKSCNHPNKEPVIYWESVENELIHVAYKMLS